MNDYPPQRRSLKFGTVDEAVAEVEQLRRGWRKVKAWTLPQAAWHVRTIIDLSTKPPAGPATVDEAAARPMLAGWIQHGKIPDGMTTADDYTPPVNASEADIDKLVASLRGLDNYPHEMAAHLVFGPIPAADNKAFHLLHLAHHLGFFVPSDPSRR
jgi:hypothetical protein